MGARPEIHRHFHLAGLLAEYFRRGGVRLRSLRENQVWQLLLALVWILIVACGYYAVHKPFSADQILNLSRLLIDFSAAVALALLAGGLGRRFLRAANLAPLERLAVQAGLGWGILGLLWLTAGLLGAFHSWIAWAALIGGLCLMRRTSLAWIAELADLKRIWHASSNLGKALASTVALMAGIQLAYALAPPVQWDALMYHLQLPRQYLAAGRFYFVADNPYWGQPQLGEFLYSVAQVLSRNQTAALVGWTLQSLFLLGVIGSVARRCGGTSGWVACFALMAGYSFRWLMSSAYVDGLAALLGYATLTALMAGLKERNLCWFGWSGLFAGLAMWSKLTAGLLLPVLAACIIISKPRLAWQNWKMFLFPSLVALIVFSPWPLINFIHSGNPIYPQIWPTELTSVQRLAYFEREAQSAGNQVLWLPLAATWFGVEGARVAGMVPYGWDPGPLLVLLALPGLIAGRNNGSVRIIGIWLIGGWSGMALLGSLSPLLWQTRLYAVLLPAVGLAAGYGWQALAQFRTPRLRFERILAALVAMVAVTNLWQDVQQISRQNPIGASLEPQSESQYLDSRLGWFPAAMRAIGELPQDASTIFLWEPRGLYAPLNASPDIWIDRWYLARRLDVEPDRILNRWRAAGFTHLLINRSGAAFEFSVRNELTQQDRRALDELLAKLELLKDVGGVYRLYGLSP